MARDRKKRATPFEGEESVELVYLDSFTDAKAKGEAWADEDLDFEVTVEEPIDIDDDDLFVLTVVEPEEGPTLPRPRVVPTPLPQVLEVLGRARERDSVLDLLAFAEIPKASITVVLLVKDEVAHGLRASGTTVPEEEVRGLATPLQAGGLLHQAMERGQLVRGSATQDHVQQVISRYLLAPEPTEACVAPVKLGKRVVNLVCVQTADPEGIPPEAEAALKRLADAAAQAYIRLIRHRKGQKTLS